MVHFKQLPSPDAHDRQTCGTPLPAETDETNVYVTAGTLDEPLGAGIRTYLFCASRADWDRDADGARYFDEQSG